MQMPFTITSISFWRSYYNADDFCRGWFSENYIENVLPCNCVFKPLAQRPIMAAHTIASCQLVANLWQMLGASYVHSTGCNTYCLSRYLFQFPFILMALPWTWSWKLGLALSLSQTSSYLVSLRLVLDLVLLDICQSGPWLLTI